MEAVIGYQENCFTSYDSAPDSGLAFVSFPISLPRGQATSESGQLGCESLAFELVSMEAVIGYQKIASRPMIPHPIRAWHSFLVSNFATTRASHLEKRAVRLRTISDD